MIDSVAFRMRPDWMDIKKFPLRVQLRPTRDSWSESFTWLYNKILKLGIDYREVFQTTSNADSERFVYFSEPYRKLAVHFMIKWGQ